MATVDALSVFQNVQILVTFYNFATCLIQVIFHLEKRTNYKFLKRSLCAVFLRNVGNLLASDAASYPRNTESSTKCIDNLISRSVCFVYK